MQQSAIFAVIFDIHLRNLNETDVGDALRPVETTAHFDVLLETFDLFKSLLLFAGGVRQASVRVGTV